MAKKANDLFEAINMINDKKKRDFDISKVNPYILSLWISQDGKLIKYANKLNPYIFSINNKISFMYYFDIIPKGRRFIRWTKKEKNVDDKEIEDICRKYNISPREARLSLNK